MEHLPLIILVLIVGTVSIVVDRRIQLRRAAQQAAADARTEQAANATAPTPKSAGLGNRLRKWRQRVSVQEKPDPIQTFRTWSVEAFADKPEVRYWLAALPDSALKAFLDELNLFCQQLGFELNWVVEKQVNAYPVLTQRLQAIILQYANACRDAVLAQDELKIFKAWQTFDQNPYGKEEQIFAQKLFNQLVTQGITPALPEHLKTGHEQERQIYIVQILRQERERQSMAFQQAISGVVSPGEQAPPAATAAPTEIKRTWFKKVAPETTPA